MNTMTTSRLDTIQTKAEDLAMIPGREPQARPRGF
jgi:hypothetical protein